MIDGKITRIVVIITFLFCSCQHSGKELYKFDPNTLEEGEFNLSVIADDISYIPLDDSIIIQGVNTFFNPVFTTDRIYHYDRNHGIMVFSRSGKFICKIGSKGRGPGEYQFGHTFTVDPGSGSVYVKDQESEIKVYSHCGNYLRSLSLKDSQGSIDRLDFYNKKLFASFNIQFGDDFKFEWVFLDTLGNIVTGKNRSIPIFKSNYLVGGGTFFNGEKLSFWHNFNDTIITFDNDFNYNPAFLLSGGEFRLPKHYVDDPMKRLNDYVHFQQILETSRYLIIRYNFYKGKNSLVLIDKKNHKTCLSYYTKDDLKGFINDLDGGIRFQPRGYMVENGREYLIEVKDAFNIKAYSASQEFKNIKPVKPGMKTAYKALADSLKETSNPVIMIVRLKR
jgi:hypothetical protein